MRVARTAGGPGRSVEQRVLQKKATILSVFCLYLCVVAVLCVLTEYGTYSDSDSRSDPHRIKPYSVIR